MKTITIITPTYNRATLLVRLYESLKNQTVFDFEWLIVDDGSTDETKRTVQAFGDANPFPICYIEQENGGKHRALNKGIAQIESELTFIVDSDDFLPTDAIATILSYHDKYKDKDYLCGYSFLRCYEDGSVNTAYFAVDEEIATYREVRINGNIGGDKAEVFFTKVLKEYPFPEYEGEKFLPEDLIWIQMSGPYEMVHINKCVYISEYLEGGLTQSGRAMKIHSPKGMMSRSIAFLQDRKVCKKVQIKMMLLYIVYGRFDNGNMKELLTKIPEKGLFLLMWFPAQLIYRKWKREYTSAIKAKGI